MDSKLKELCDSPNSEIMNNNFIYSTGRLLYLTASGRHLSETMLIIKQLKFKASHSKPLCCPLVLSRQTGHSSKEVTNCEEVPLTDQEA